MLLNNIAIKLSMNQIQFVTPRHQNWAMEIFAAVKSDLVPDFMNKMQINHMITPEILLNITKGQMDQKRYNEASLMIVRYKFHEHFDIHKLMMLLCEQ